MKLQPVVCGLGRRERNQELGIECLSSFQEPPEGRVTNSRHSVGKSSRPRHPRGCSGARRPRLHGQGVHRAALVRPGPRIRSPERGAPRGRGDERAEGAGGASWEIQQHGAPGLRALWPPRVPAAGAAVRLTSEPRPASCSPVPPARRPRPLRLPGRAM